MGTTSKIENRLKGAAKRGPRFVFAPAYEEPDAEAQFGGPPAHEDESLGYMSDDALRDCAKRMHYAAWRSSLGQNAREEARWLRRYYDCRNRIVIGNRKLTFRAVQKWGSISQTADELAGECQIVLINAVAAFNPWMNIRFSTYAFTCLMRALSRLSKRVAADRLLGSLPLDSLPPGEPCSRELEEIPVPGLSLLGEYLKDSDTLLTSREKFVLNRRFHLNDEARATETLEQVGRDLGVSKERVRQVQKLALGKLRLALLSATSAS